MCEELAAYIAAHVAGFSFSLDGSTPGTNIFIHRQPPSPDQSLTLYQYTGAKPQLTLGRTVAWVNPRLQVINRASEAQGVQQAFADAKSVYDLLIAVVDQSVGGTAYISILPSGEPQELGPDPSNRQRVVTSYDVMKKES
jgi:Bacteriophage minor capsid protein